MCQILCIAPLCDMTQLYWNTQMIIMCFQYLLRFFCRIVRLWFMSSANICRAGLSLWGVLGPKYFVGPHYTYSLMGWGLGRGLCPLSRKFLHFLSKWWVFVHSGWYYYYLPFRCLTWLSVGTLKPYETLGHGPVGMCLNPALNICQLSFCFENDTTPCL